MAAATWACSVCTYVQSTDIETCEMCGQGHRPDVSAAVAKGGKWACPVCTAHNDMLMDALCKVCGTGKREDGEPVDEDDLGGDLRGGGAAGGGAGRKPRRRRQRAAPRKKRADGDGDEGAPSRLAHVAKSVYDTRDMTHDIVLVVGPAGHARRIPAHRSFLAAVSTRAKELLFDAAPADRPKAASGGEGCARDPAILELPEENPDAMEALVRFIYLESWEANADLVDEVLAVANRWGVPGLARAVHVHVRDTFGVDVALHALILGMRMEDGDLCMSAVTACCNDVEHTLKQRDRLAELDANTITLLLSYPEFSADEVDIFEAVLHWANAKALAAGAAPRGGAGAAAGAVAAAAGGGGELSTEALLSGMAPGPALRAQIPDALLTAVRFPLIHRTDLADIVRSSGVLTAHEVCELLAYSMRSPEQRRFIKAVGKFSTEPRMGMVTVLDIHMWGGGGGSGQDSGCGRGGAGGYLHVRYEYTPGEKLFFFVGEGGHSDGTSDASPSRGGWPNGGKGGYNWVSGGGGGATYFRSSLHGEHVVAGAGGGGGGTGAQSWSSGGGGGGGTREGKVGDGGAAGLQSSRAGHPGNNGNGDGGYGDGQGSAKTGDAQHGAGGTSGSRGTSAAGGGGGDCSVMHGASIVTRTNGDGDAAISVKVGGHSHSAGGGGKSPKTSGENGLIVLVLNEGASTKTFSFTGSPQEWVMQD